MYLLYERLSNLLDNSKRTSFFYLKQWCLNLIKRNDRTFDNVYYKWFNIWRIYKKFNKKENDINLIAWISCKKKITYDFL